MKTVKTSLVLSLGLLLTPFFPATAQTYQDQQLSSEQLVLPELEQFQLGAKLFWDNQRYIASWKAFQTFVYNYPKSYLAADAQFMMANAIFAEASSQLKAGNAPDELGWKDGQQGSIGKGLRKGLEGIKNLGATVTGEERTDSGPERISEATFSEAIKQFEEVLTYSKKTGLHDSALLRIGECYYNMKDYANALKYFREVEKKFSHGYLTGEAILAGAQCYIPGGDLGSAESEVQRLITYFPSYAKDPRAQTILGVIRYNEGNYEEALKHFSQIESAEALYFAGQCYLQLDKALLASGKFKEITEKYPDSSYGEIASYLMADAFFRSKNTIAAANEFRVFMKTYPNSTLKEAALFRVAACALINQDYPSAREGFNFLLNTYPNGEYAALSRYFIAESFRFANQMKEASFSYGQLIAQQPNNPITGYARFKLGWVTYAQGNYNGTIEALQKFFDWHAFHPLVPDAYLLLGNAHYNLKNYEEAAIDYQQAFDRAPKNSELAESAMALLNSTRYSQKNYGQITSGYTYMLKSLPPTDSQWRAASMLYLADSYYRQNLYSDAITVFHQVADLYPNRPAAILAYDGMSWSYFKQGEFDQAQKAREKISQVRLPIGTKAPDMDRSNYELANALFNQKKYAEALALYTKYLNDKPAEKDIPDTIYRIGLCYYRQEYYSQAIEEWKQLTLRFPNHEQTEEADFQTADIYFRAQKYDQAIEAYRKIVGLYPKNPKAIESLDLLEISFDRLEANEGEKSHAKIVGVLKRLASLDVRGELGAEAQFRLARRYFTWGDYAKSAEEFNKTVISYPDSKHAGDAQFFTGESFYTLKKYQEAIEAYNRFLVNFPKSDYAPAARFHLGTSQFNSGDFKNAIASYGELLRTAEKSEFAPAALFNMALAQKKMVLLEDAANSFKRLSIAYPQDPNAINAGMEWTRILIEQKKFGEALIALRDLEPKIPKDSEEALEVAYHIGEAYEGQKELDDAIKSFAKMVEMSAARSVWKLEALRKLGAIYEGQEEWKKAIAAYNSAATMSSDATVSKSFKDRADYLQETYLNKKKG